jgi:uncharacterized protein with NRDE domain
MCLILFAYDTHPSYRLILAANRDEFYERPSARMEFWKDHPQILAGRDLKMSGTWMGITRQGKIAAVTNYREAAVQNIDAPSRGHIVSDYLCSETSAEGYLEKMEGAGHRYNGFNLLIGDTSALYYYSNRGGASITLEPGVHGLSNHLLNTPWPKVTRGKKRLTSIIESAQHQIPNRLSLLLQSLEPAPDHQLPETGVGYAREKMLSPIFIASPDYGTRCSTILMMDHSRGVQITELTWQSNRIPPEIEAKREFRFTMDDGPNYF